MPDIHPDLVPALQLSKALELRARAGARVFLNRNCSYLVRYERRVAARAGPAGKPRRRSLEVVLQRLCEKVHGRRAGRGASQYLVHLSLHLQSSVAGGVQGARLAEAQRAVVRVRDQSRAVSVRFDVDVESAAGSDCFLAAHVCAAAQGAEEEAMQTAFARGGGRGGCAGCEGVREAVLAAPGVDAEELLFHARPPGAEAVLAQGMLPLWRGGQPHGAWHEGQVALSLQPAEEGSLLAQADWSLDFVIKYGEERSRGAALRTCPSGLHRLRAPAGPRLRRCIAQRPPELPAARPWEFLWPAADGGSGAGGGVAELVREPRCPLCWAACSTERGLEAHFAASHSRLRLDRRARGGHVSFKVSKAKAAAAPASDRGPFAFSHAGPRMVPRVAARVADASPWTGQAADEAWRSELEQRELEEFQDVSAEEKEMMLRWNAFVQAHVPADCGRAKFVRLCRQFAAQNRVWLGQGRVGNFALLALNLASFGLVDPSDVAAVMADIQGL
jgi:hypothetical protein